MRIFTKKVTAMSVLLIWLFVSFSVVGHPYDLRNDKITYICGYAHLDTQWQWNLARTIRDYIPNTLRTNFSHFSNYSNYTFTFEGSYRYYLAKRHYASDYATLKNYVASGRWAVGGSWVDGCDVMVPSAESLIRHTLYGNGFFQEEFGKRSIDILLPDCFGFPYSLPTIANHCALIGFSTQKFDLWGGWCNTPFPVGQWQGVDGSKIIACLKPGSYGGAYNIRTSDGDNTYNNSNPHVWCTYDYMGTGDTGGGPSASNVSSCNSRINQNGSNDIKVVNESSDQIFRDFLAHPELIDGLPTFNDELCMKTHGAGCYSSWSRMKWYNRMNEQRGAAAEHASVCALHLKGTTYPQDDLAWAWTHFIAHQMHDDLTGTSIPSAYSDHSLPAEDSSLTEFTEMRDAANAEVASIMNTTVHQTNRIPVVVQNPLGFARKDIVDVTINWGSSPPSNIQVFGPDGTTEVPSQILTTAGNYTRIAFVAEVGATGYKVYEVSPTQSSITTELSISTSTLENEFYTVSVNSSGDITQVHDKKSNQDLLSSASRWEMRTDNGTTFPAWEITYNNCTANPREYVSGSVQRTVEEDGPARISLKVTRSQDGSNFTHYIRLGTGEAGSYVEVSNVVDWRSDGTLLKVSFPTSASSSNMDFDMGIGAISRPNRTNNRYEVCGHQWADLSESGYGISVLNNCKYGWDKASNSLFHLTLTHSPSGGGYNYQRDLSNLINWVHQYTYAIYGHAGAWNSANSDVVHEGERLNQPLVGIQATPHEGWMDREFSFLTISDPANVSLMALKHAERENAFIVRVREIKKASHSNVGITFLSNVASCHNVDGQEYEITAQSELPRNKPGAVSSSTTSPTITFDLRPFEIRAFAVALAPTGIRGGSSSDEAIKATIPFSLQVLQRKLHFLLYPNETVKKVVVTTTGGKTICEIPVNGPVHYWDGRSAGGSHVASGVYIVNVITNKRHTSQNVSVIR